MPNRYELGWPEPQIECRNFWFRCFSDVRTNGNEKINKTLSNDSCTLCIADEHQLIWWCCVLTVAIYPSMPVADCCASCDQHQHMRNGSWMAQAGYRTPHAKTYVGVFMLAVATEILYSSDATKTNPANAPNGGKQIDERYMCIRCSTNANREWDTTGGQQQRGAREKKIIFTNDMLYKSGWMARKS